MLFDGRKHRKLRTDKWNVRQKKHHRTISSTATGRRSSLRYDQHCSLFVRFLGLYRWRRKNYRAHRNNGGSWEHVWTLAWLVYLLRCRLRLDLLCLWNHFGPNLLLGTFCPTIAKNCERLAEVSYRKNQPSQRQYLKRWSWSRRIWFGCLRRSLGRERDKF